MKARFPMMVCALTGFGLGAVAVQSLHAQATPPVYYVGEVEVTDQAGYQRDFVPQSGAQVQMNGGRFLARGGKVTPLTGTAPPSRIVIMQWDSMDAMNKWFNSDAQKKLREVQAKYAKVQAFAVEGLPQK